MTDFGLHPASAGSIIGYLRVDKSDWDAKLAEAKAQADELSRDNTRIHISTNMTEVLAELAVIAQAKDAVGGDAHISVSADKLPSFGNQTATVQVSSTGSVAAVAAQRELAAAIAETSQAESEASSIDQDALRVKGALNNALIDEQIALKHATAEAKYEADQIAWNNGALKQLIEARNAARQAALDGAQADDVAAGATQQGGAAAAAATGVWARFAPVILAASTAVIPLGAGVATLGAGFLALGVAGTVAVAGINEQVQAGTTLGKDFDGALQTLHGDLSHLETVAAAGVLVPFLAGAAQFQQAMPEITSEMAGFSNVAGHVASDVVVALVNGFTVMAPALAQSAQWIQTVAAGFAGWSSNGGLQTFGDYALRVLPEVEQLLGSMGNIVAQVFIALAPLGADALTILTGVATGVSDVTSAINTLPVGTVTTLAGAALGAWAAFKLWGLISPILGGVGVTMAVMTARIRGVAAAAAEGATASEALAVGEAAAGIAATGAGDAIDAALGPIGWVVAGLGALALAWVAATSNAGPSIEAVQSYTDALKQDNDAIGANVQAVTAKALADSGALQQAKDLGVSNQQLKDVVDGMPGAMDSLNASLAQNRQAAVDAAQATDHAGKANSALKFAYTDGSKSVQGWDAEQKALLGTLTSQAGALGAAMTKQQAYNAFLSAGASPTQAMTDANKAMATSLANEGLAADGTVVSLDKLVSAMQASGLLTISADQAAVGWYQSLDNLSQSIQKNGRSLDITTKAGQTNELALLGVASAGNTLISANAKNGVSEAELQKTLGQTYDALIASEGQFGITGGAADTMARKLLGIPPNVPIHAAINGYADTLLKAAGITQAVANIPRFVGINVVTQYSSTGTPSNVSSGRGGSGGLTMADGGLVQHMADGGFTGLLTGHGSGTSDSVPIMGSAGEYMVRSAARQKYGLPMMNSINDGTFQPNVQVLDNGPMQMTGTLVLDSGELMGTFTGVATRVADGRISEMERHRANMRGGRA